MRLNPAALRRQPAGKDKFSFRYGQAARLALAVAFGPMVVGSRNAKRMTSMGLVHQKYKVAVVQAAPVFLDLDATVDKTIAENSG